MKRTILAYSGGLDTSIIIPWIKENLGHEVIAMAADVGQGEELEGLREKALTTGASKIYIEDLKREFVEDYIWPAVRAGAIYEGKYLLGTSLARPLIAKRLVEIARKEGADSIAHGATGKGNDQVRFELTVKALAPDLKIIAPWRLWQIQSREDAIEYANARGIPVPVKKDRPYSMDRNLWHLSHEGADLEDPGNEPQDDICMLVTPPEKAPNHPTYVELDFEQGIPVKLNGKTLDGVSLISELNQIAGASGVGILDLLENRLVGIKSRGVYETPAGTVISEAHQLLESLCLDRPTQHYKRLLSERYSELVYDGMWFHSLREALDCFFREIQKTITGKVRLKLYKGRCTPAGVWSKYALYDRNLSSFGKDAIYNQKDAEGFINLFGLSMKVKALVGTEKGISQ